MAALWYIRIVLQFFNKVLKVSSSCCLVWPQCASYLKASVDFEVKFTSHK